METIIYAKYNSMRCPQYQTMTLIVEKNGQRWVEKRPLLIEAGEHVDGLVEKKKLADDLYKNVRAVEVSRGDSGAAVFPFVRGETVGGMIESGLDSLDQVIRQMKQYMELIDDYREEMLVDFQSCREFEEVFGRLSYQGKAARIANIDEILDNFLVVDGGLVLIDYEWVFDFPVPVRFIQFRTVYYFLVKNHSIITKKMSETDFLRGFDYSESETAMWKAVEDHFQEHVHGQNRQYMYPLQYEKELHDIQYLMEHVSDIGGEFARTRAELEESQRLLQKKLSLGFYVDYWKSRKRRKKQI